MKAVISAREVIQTYRIYSVNSAGRTISRELNFVTNLRMFFNIDRAKVVYLTMKLLLF